MLRTLGMRRRGVMSVRHVVGISGLLLGGSWALAAEQPLVNGAPSPTATRVRPLPLVVPGTPRAAIGATGVEFTWSDRSPNETGFELERNPRFPVGRVQLPANSTRFVDEGAPPGAQYRVRAVSNRSRSAWTRWTLARDAANTIPVLVPGKGFAEPTRQPAPVGTAGVLGHDARVIARWNVVPYQTFAGEFALGVVAFHINGIDRVDFSVNGGPWTSVRNMVLNPASGTWEYAVRVRSEDVGEGLVEIRAVAWPADAGEPRVLAGEIDQDGLANGEHSMLLRSDPRGRFGPPDIFVSATRGNDATGNGTASAPYATVWRAMQHFAGRDIAGLDILLEPGEYAYGAPSTSGRPFTTEGWVTIRPVPGSPPGSVRFVSGGRFRVAHIRLKDVVLDFRGGGAIGNFTISTLPSMLWLEGVHAIGPGATTGARAVPPANWLGLYFINSRIESFTDGVMHAQIARNVHVSDLGQDAFTGTKLVVNCTADRVKMHPGTSFHPDVYQFSVRPGQVSDNNIVYGLRATNIDAQGLFADDGGTINNVAFVNVSIEQVRRGGKSQWKDVASNHILFWHTTLFNQPMSWRTNRHTNISIRGSAWDSLEGVRTLLTPGARVDAKNNHFVLTPGLPFGIDTTIGPMPSPTAFSRVGMGATGVLQARVPRPLTPIDAANRQRTFPTDIGATLTRADVAPH